MQPIYNKYMLATSKVKEHGMADPRWTMGDKCDQFRGIVALYGREKKTIKKDTNDARNKQLNELENIRKKIKDGRLDLKMALYGNKQSLRNTLAEHRDLQLALQNQHTDDVIENVKQLNFLKKKEYDQLKYQKEKKAKILLELKVDSAVIQDRLKHGIKAPDEDLVQILTGKLEDAELKKNVAITIQRNFTNIRDIMKKDALYFDSILISLKQDSAQQGSCLYRATKIGQLATEYLDDRIQDYNILQKAVKRSTKTRQHSIRKIKAQIKDTTSQLRYLLSRHGDTEFTNKAQSPSEIDLQRNIDSLDSILKFIQTTTYVGQYEEILPRMEDQHHQFIRLKDLVNDQTKVRDLMLKKRNHAQLMYDTLSTTMASTTFQYIEEKKRFEENMKEVKTRLRDYDHDMAEVGDTVLMIRTSLQQLTEMTKCVVVAGENIVDLWTEKSDVLVIPEKLETNVAKLLQILHTRYQVLMSNYEELPPESQEEAANLYQRVVETAFNRAHEHEFLKTIDFHIEVTKEPDDPTIPTRADIKKRSSLVVEDCAKKDDDQPIILLPLRGKQY